MKRYVSWLVCGLYLILAGFCSAADSISIPLDCKGLQASGAGQQRVEVPAAGFSVIPPQGENWCVRSMASEGFTFFKHPANVEIPAQPPIAQRLVPSGAPNSSIHGDGSGAPGVRNRTPVA